MITTISRTHTALLVVATCAAILASDASAQTPRKAKNRAESESRTLRPVHPGADPGRRALRGS